MAPPTAPPTAPDVAVDAGQLRGMIGEIEELERRLQDARARRVEALEQTRGELADLAAAVHVRGEKDAQAQLGYCTSEIASLELAIAGYDSELAKVAAQLARFRAALRYTEANDADAAIAALQDQRGAELLAVADDIEALHHRVQLLAKVHSEVQRRQEQRGRQPDSFRTYIGRPITTLLGKWLAFADVDVPHVSNRNIDMLESYLAEISARLKS